MTNSRNNIAKILAILEKNYPNPATELNFETPWQLLVAAVLSAQSTDKQVNKVTKHLFAKYPAPGDMAVVSPEQLAEDIKILGLYRTKSKYLVAAARKICKDYGGKVPKPGQSWKASRVGANSRRNPGQCLGIPASS